jgi:hypothetical protein
MEISMTAERNDYSPVYVIIKIDPYIATFII